MTIVGAARRAGTARLIEFGPEDNPPSLGTHLRRHGALPLPDHDLEQWGDRLLVEIERSGLTGRGGAGFPSFEKLRIARSTGSPPSLIANAMEGEPASGKDRRLITRAPHLVLDGAELVAAALGVTNVILCVPNDPGDLARILSKALKDRSESGYSRTALQIREVQARYVAGEESALVDHVAGGSGLPKFRPDKSVPLAIGRQSTVVHNVETLANVALIARNGADWFREVGDPEAPGTRLVTISGAVERPGVVEVPTGTSIEKILSMARPTSTLQAVLVGGYGGVWLGRSDVATRYSPAALRCVGAQIGAGVLIALASTSCGIRETERIAQFMAVESAGQCGPCLFGLPAIADDLRSIASGAADQATLNRLRHRCDAVAGRGACRHPDGVVRLVRSALEVFSSDIASHIRGVSCAGSRHQGVLASRPGLARRR